jgi:hypothetical protein
MDPQFNEYQSLLALAAKCSTKSALRKAMNEVGFAVNLDNPISGYFRKRRGKDGPLDPVAIWRDGDDLYILWGGIEARLESVWPQAVWMPVPYAWYEAKTEHGIEWPDVHKLPKEDEPLDPIEELVGRSAESEAPGPGHNSGATLDEVRLLADQIDEAKRGVKQYAAITSDEQRAQSQDLRSELLRLSGDADKQRKALTRPHKEAVDAINAKWMPLVEGAKIAADAIRTAQEAWGTLKLRRQREAEAKAEAERRRLEVEALERVAEAQAAVDRGEPPPEPLPPPPEPMRVAPQTSFKGGTGRAAHEKAVEVITEVTDWAALFLYFVEDKDVRLLVSKKAQAILKNTGQIPPGCKTDVAAKVA